MENKLNGNRYSTCKILITCKILLASNQSKVLRRTFWPCGSAKKVSIALFTVKSVWFQWSRLCHMYCIRSVPYVKLERVSTWTKVVSCLLCAREYPSLSGEKTPEGSIFVSINCNGFCPFLVWVAYALYTLNNVHNSCTNRLKQEFECMNICSRRVPVFSIQVTGWIRFVLGPRHPNCWCTIC